MGRNSKDIWVGSFSELHHFDGTTWTRVTGAAQAPEQAPGFPMQIGGCGDQAVWIATDEGVSSFDGTTWSESRPRSPWLNAIWGVSPDNLVGVGPGASIIWHAP